MTKEEKKQALKDLGDLPEDVYNEIGQDYLANGRKLLEKLEAAVNAGNFETCRFVGHGIKGSSLNMRLTELSLLGAEIEKASLAKDAAKIGTLCAEVAAKLKEAESVFDNLGI